MRRLTCTLVLALIGLFVPYAAAQEKTKGPDIAKSIIGLKVTVVFSEYDGEKKVSILPYTLLLRAADEHERYIGILRIGVKVPIWTGGKESQVQYQEVGSNIDCDVRSAEEGRYLVDMRVDRSSIFPISSNKDEHSTDQKLEEQPHLEPPVVRTFRGSFALLLRDGQTMQGTVATDPLNGHTVKIDVTLNVVK
jgi:hypothetical protein